jgi:hypothetical protein
VTIHPLRSAPSPELAKALAEFESRFTYPLGPGRSFRISHGEDYPRFFRAIGNATCFVAERACRVVGAVSVAVRPIMTPDGSLRQAAYIGDLKVDPEERGSLVFLRLAQAADAWARPQVTAAYGVVMNGTPASPTEYTGRVGVPSFLQLGKVIVLRLSTAIESSNECLQITHPKNGEDCFRNLSRGRYAALGGDPTERSEMEPHWLVHPDGLACGRLEDTYRAKRLFVNDGTEMQSTHLSCFAWRTPQAAVELIHAALHQAAQAGLPSLFVALAEADMQLLEPLLHPIEKVIAPATIYGVGLESDRVWNINSSEI